MLKVEKILKRLRIAEEAKIIITAMFFIILLPALARPGYLPLLTVIFIACVYFFREPLRKVPGDPASIVSPASGRVANIEIVKPAIFGGRPVRRIEFSLSLLDVHIQRYPYAGRIAKIILPNGKTERPADERIAAFRKCNFILVNAGCGLAIGLRQITGLVARRIICNACAGKDVKKGDKLGLIVFGSHVNLYLPADIEVLVKKGDRVIDGETVIARLK